MLLGSLSRLANQRVTLFMRLRPRLHITMTSACTTKHQSTTSDLKLKVVHVPDKLEFCIHLDPPDRAVLEYDVLADGSVDMHHTEVPSSYRGRGIAGQLAKAAFGHFNAERTKMLLTCTYLQKYYREHPEASSTDLISLPS